MESVFNKAALLLTSNSMNHVGQSLSTSLATHPEL